MRLRSKSYEAATLAEAEELMKDDPYAAGGAIANYQISAWEMINVNIELMRPAAA